MSSAGPELAVGLQEPVCVYRTIKSGYILAHLRAKSVCASGIDGIDLFVRQEAVGGEGE